jgi:rhodanese-related sulfurtransferase
MVADKASEFVLIDVRGEEEVRVTGPLIDDAVTVPLPEIMYGALGMEAEDWEERFGFPKPSVEATLVFSCKAGVRSDQASQMAIEAGYIKVINHLGGADEWFNPR